MNSNKGMVLSVHGITKTFAGVKALDDVSLELSAGRVHGLIGANGAGKSTLIKILAGAYQPDSGVIVVDGHKVTIANPHVAETLGLSFIHQDLGLIERFNVLENITLGLPKAKRMCFIDWRATEKRVQSVIKQIGFNQPLTTQVRNLSVANKWLVAIGRAIFQQARFIAMDEPTSSLTQTEVQMLFRVIRELTARGVGIIYVSHRLDEIIEICDEITVFKDGHNVLNAPTANLTKQEIIGAIAGHAVEAMVQREYGLHDRNIVFKASELSDGGKVKNVSFVLGQGEVLGITGLVGSGRTELAMAMFGANAARFGSMELLGAPYAPKSPADAVAKGVVIVPEERRTQGLCVTKSVSFNINLPDLTSTRAVPSLPFTNKRKAAKIARNVIDVLQVKAPGLNSPVSSLSGGNQQKLVIGKWLNLNPRIFILDEPTRGVDVGARAEIYKEIKRISNTGASFVVVSSDVEELPGLCDRVLVMSEGSVAGELTGTDISKDALLQLCYAHKQ